MDNPAINTEGVFNQGMYQQGRINELETRINSCYTNPLLVNPLYFTYNYNIMMNDLTSLFMTISAELTPKEREDMNKKVSEFKSFLVKNPIHSACYDTFGKKMKRVNYTAWQKLEPLLLSFWQELERLMKLHGIGNPTKDNPRNIVLK